MKVTGTPICVRVVNNHTKVRVRSAISFYGRDLGIDWAVVVQKGCLGRHDTSGRKTGAREGR
jgi:hypothetical protein